MSTKPPPPSRTADQFVVRFPDGMRDRIAEAAKASGRSMNAEIVARLGASFAQDAISGASPSPDSDFGRRLATLEDAVARMVSMKAALHLLESHVADATRAMNEMAPTSSAPVSSRKRSGTPKRTTK